MTDHSRTSVLEAIARDGIVPVFYEADPAIASEVAEAVAAGGLHTLEFTNRGDGAIGVLARLIESSRAGSADLMIGAGSIIDPASAAAAIDLGARFVFAPAFSPAVAEACNLRNVPYVPGCATVTEILAAYRAGCDYVKLFPANSIGGPEYLEAISAPCPWIRAIPTGGVEPTAESLGAWFRAGAPAVGIGSKLLPKRLIEGRDFPGLALKVSDAVGAVAAARSSS
jgi:2-dehydro-3-deoxyphosphogluconate aldolase/(4S)-4-hydroxy-2-oxoglutarate aldolase